MAMSVRNAVLSTSSDWSNKSGSVQDVRGVGAVGARASLHSTHSGLHLANLSVPSFPARRNSSFLRYEAAMREAEERVVLNVAGMKYDVLLGMLSRFPDTLLGNTLRLHKHYDPARDEYYFNRDRMCFEAILQYYQTGLLRRPPNVRLDIFVEEARFFQLGADAFAQFCQDEGFEQEKPKPQPANRLQRAVWDFVEHPQSSAAAKFFAVLSMLVIVTSIVIFCLETLPQFEEPANRTNYVPSNRSALAVSVSRGYAQFREPLFILETVCIAWFTLEFILRLAACPDKRHFLKQPLNIIDMIAILPYYVDLVVVLVALRRGTDAAREGGVLTVLRILRLVRVFRIFKLSRHSRGLQILGQTFWMSIRELGLLLLFLGIGVILFSSAVYYAEQGYEETQFSSIPEAFWWAIVTMTTVGYGDVAPKAVFGKMVGTACAVSGLIAVALPVPIIVANFNTIYQRERSRTEMEEVFGDIFQVPEAAPGEQQELTKSVDKAQYTHATHNGRKADFRRETAPILEENSR
ncbi:potassium voltage-gated channel subfamily A member 2-like [Paramacrobiotus metropolitanus]|uniref:potassium voltage-gated channel subfamily A member 2-like n=1 Tax=Paramacrobiotus metropolitanus TaxID=2943436 RepID=UPI002445C379|nr:potassium voltage-gated channel subfamily A member 2-like [Paramacrobiotus metropolitanus]